MDKSYAFKRTHQLTLVVYLVNQLPRGKPRGITNEPPILFRSKLRGKALRENLILATLLIIGRVSLFAKCLIIFLAYFRRLQ